MVHRGSSTHDMICNDHHQRKRENLGLDCIKSLSENTEYIQLRLQRSQPQPRFIFIIFSASSFNHYSTCYARGDRNPKKNYRKIFADSNYNADAKNNIHYFGLFLIIFQTSLGFRDVLHCVFFWELQQRLQFVQCDRITSDMFNASFFLKTYFTLFRATIFTRLKSASIWFSLRFQERRAPARSHAQAGIPILVGTFH